jgi:hypothetical protein
LYKRDYGVFKRITGQLYSKEIWMLTFGAAFQGQVSIIKQLLSSKRALRNKTRYIVDVVLDGYKTGNVSDEQHIDNIKNISAYSSNFRKYL